MSFKLEDEIKARYIKKLEAIASTSFAKMNSLPIISIDRRYYEARYFFYKAKADSLRQVKT